MSNIAKKAALPPVATPPSLWGSVNPSMLSPEIRGKADRIKWVQRGPDSLSGNVSAFVTTEDWDGDGDPDDIYVVTSGLDQIKDLAQFISRMDEILRHETAHIELGSGRSETISDDGTKVVEFNFADESVAHGRELGDDRSLEEVIRRNPSLNQTAELSAMEALIKISNKLDELGEFDISNKIDRLIGEYDEENNLPYTSETAMKSIGTSPDSDDKQGVLRDFVKGGFSYISHNYYSPDEYIEIIMNSGPKGFSVGDKEIDGSSEDDWIMFLDLINNERSSLSEDLGMLKSFARYYERGNS
jgi:hypothetical protein